MTKSALYCFSSIPQAAASVYFYDFNKDKNDGLKYKVEEIIKILKDNSFNPLQTNSYDISSFADGAYPFYVKINNSKKVDTIYFELRNSCGWGSSMFFERPERLVKEREMKKNALKPGGGFVGCSRVLPNELRTYRSRGNRGLNWPTPFMILYREVGV